MRHPNPSSKDHGNRSIITPRDGDRSENLASSQTHGGTVRTVAARNSLAVLRAQSTAKAAPVSFRRRAS